MIVDSASFQAPLDSDKELDSEKENWCFASAKNPLPIWEK